MAKQTVKIEGLREINKAFAELPKATGNAVLRRVLMRRAQPIADRARQLAPVQMGDLRDSIAVSTKKPKGQKAASSVAFAKTLGMGGSAADARAAAKAAGGSAVKVFVGPGRHPQAIMQEFGTVNHPAQPFLRPAWDAGKDRVLDGIKDDLWDEIEKTAKRVAKRAAKRLATGAVIVGAGFKAMADTIRVAAQAATLVADREFRKAWEVGAGGGGLSSVLTGMFSRPTAIGTGSLERFATGGQFKVGGYGGIDSQLMAFRATPGEMVDVHKGDPRGRSGVPPITIVNNMSTPIGNASVKSASGRHGRELIVELQEAMAKGVRQTGSPMNQAVRSMGGRTPLVKG